MRKLYVIMMKVKGTFYTCDLDLNVTLMCADQGHLKVEVTSTKCPFHFHWYKLLLELCSIGILKIMTIIVIFSSNLRLE